MADAEQRDLPTLNSSRDDEGERGKGHHREDELDALRRVLGEDFTKVSKHRDSEW